MVSEPSMASSACSTSDTTGSTSSTSTTASNHGINPSLLLLSNMASMMTMKLDYNNYLVWRHQIEVILEAYSLINFIEDSNGAPDPFMKDSLGIIPLKQILNMFTRRIVNKHCLRLSILLSLHQFLLLQWGRNQVKEYGRFSRNVLPLFLVLMFSI